jgi:hypothetical protein
MNQISNRRAQLDSNKLPKFLSVFKSLQSYWDNTITPAASAKKQLGNAKSSFFANKGEKVVFWTSVVGLLLVVLLSGINYLRSTEAKTTTARMNQLQVGVDSLLAQQHAYESLVDSLRNEIASQQAEIGFLEETLAEKGEIP